MKAIYDCSDNPLCKHVLLGKLSYILIREMLSIMDSISLQSFQKPNKVKLIPQLYFFVYIFQYYSMLNDNDLVAFISQYILAWDIKLQTNKLNKQITIHLILIVGYFYVY